MTMPAYPRPSPESKGARPARRYAELHAEAMGVRIVARSLPATLLGFTLDRHTVVLNRRLAADEKQATIAHELGHVLVKRGFYFPRSAADEESYADSFARHLQASSQSSQPSQK
jgi:Zn-dependent peptidase ImmA (M78 family)